MQGSSCYCDSLSHSRSGRTISALPAALSQSVHNIHITHIHSHTHYMGSGSPHLKAAGEIRSDWVYECGSHLAYAWDGRGVCDRSVFSSLHTSVLLEGYVKRQTCCCSLQQPQEALEGCTSISQWRTVHVHWHSSKKLQHCQIRPWNLAWALSCANWTLPPSHLWTVHTDMKKTLTKTLEMMEYNERHVTFAKSARTAGRQSKLNETLAHKENNQVLMT